jgi:hypothetical protein
VYVYSINSLGCYSDASFAGILFSLQKKILKFFADFAI